MVGTDQLRRRRVGGCLLGDGRDLWGVATDAGSCSGAGGEEAGEMEMERPTLLRVLSSPDLAIVVRGCAKEKRPERGLRVLDEG